jgi:hypothetical protein
MRAAKNSMEAAACALAAVVDDDRLDLEPGANQGLRRVSVSVTGSAASGIKCQIPFSRLAVNDYRENQCVR